MKKIYFISDTHFSFYDSKEERERKEKFISFLDKIQKDASDIFLLGDIFDFWFEWYFVVPKNHFDLLFKFKELTKSGIKIHYITGNHDFYLGSFFEKFINIKCYDEKTDFIVNGKKFFLGHGDGYAKNDKGYRILKKILRNKLSIFLFKTFIPADLGVFLAKSTSKSSRKYRSSQKTFSQYSKEYFEFAETKFNIGYDYVLLGHMHNPEIITKTIKESPKTYINTGDWLNHFSYAVFQDDKLTLNYYK